MQINKAMAKQSRIVLYNRLLFKSLKKKVGAFGHSSVVKHWPIINEALDLIPSTAKRIKKVDLYVLM